MSIDNLNPNNSLHFNPDKWVRAYADALYSYVCSKISDTNTAQDIVQDTFLSAWKARDGYNGQASEKNWLFAICKNKITDYYRSSAKNIVSYITELNNNNDYFNADNEWQPKARPQEWTTGVETKEFYKILQQCKEKLQELQNAVFCLKYIDDLESDEICKELAISPSYYWTLIHRARLQMRACIERNWYNKK